MTVNVLVVGRTGDGKSTLCIQLAKHLGAQDATMFRPSATATSTAHRHGVDICTVIDISIHDTPGLMDAGGVEQDEANIRLIVEHARNLGYMNALVLVVNEQAPRLDDGMQNAIKLLVDSFGPSVLAYTCLVFTRADGRVAPNESLAKVAEIAALIQKRTGVTIRHLPAYQIECQPDSWQGRLMPQAIEELRTQAATTCRDLVRWARSKPQLDTSDAVIGEYEQRKAKREAEALAAEEEKRRKEEEQRRAAAEKLRDEAEASKIQAQSDAKDAADRASRAETSANEAKTAAEKAKADADAANKRADDARREADAAIARAQRGGFFDFLVPVVGAIATVVAGGAAAPVAAAAIAAHESSKKD